VVQTDGIGMSVPTFEKLGGRLLVIFDGHCGLCNRAVHWFLVRDRRDRLRFVASESPRVTALLARHGMGTPGWGWGADAPLNTILVVLDPDGPTERVLVRSQAALALLAELPGPWPAIAVALGWIPRPVRDLGYRLIARWRYRIWGRFDVCPVPTAAERERFL
jgi:predicted DCC family thiol-disulfide oxidoreductase YuxK